MIVLCSGEKFLTSVARKMSLICSVIVMSNLITVFAATADLQSIQNANPLNVDLTIPSETGLPSNGDAEVDEQKLGGYRPLYPPYFLRDTSTQPSANQPQQAYYDKEYYTRGAQPADLDDRLQRGLRIRPNPGLQLLFAGPDKNQRLISNFQVSRTEKSSASASVHVKSAISFSNVRFPSNHETKFVWY